MANNFVRLLICIFNNIKHKWATHGTILILCDLRTSVSTFSIWSDSKDSRSTCGCSIINKTSGLHWRSYYKATILDFSKGRLTDSLKAGNALVTIVLPMFMGSGTHLTSGDPLASIKIKNAVAFFLFICRFPCKYISLITFEIIYISLSS